MLNDVVKFNIPKILGNVQHRLESVLDIKKVLSTSLLLNIFYHLQAHYLAESCGHSFHRDIYIAVNGTYGA